MLLPRRERKGAPFALGWFVQLALYSLEGRWRIAQMSYIFLAQLGYQGIPLDTGHLEEKSDSGRGMPGRGSPHPFHLPNYRGHVQGVPFLAFVLPRGAGNHVEVDPRPLTDGSQDYATSTCQAVSPASARAKDRTVMLIISVDPCSDLHLGI